MSRFAQAVSLLGLALLPALSVACDRDSESRQQVVYADWNYRPIDSWPVKGDDIRALRLPNGYRLGVRIEPRQSKEGVALEESVKISLFDLSSPEPTLLTQTYGGANSVQGYGSQGGADKVVELGDPGLRLILLKPFCE